MCGIVGYIGGSKPISFLVETLKRLEYRGYDSCGVAYRVKDSLRIILKKRRGKIEGLKRELSSHQFDIGIAHTRWATHGIPNRINAHPHFDCQRHIFVVHNGIVENYKELKKFLLKRGHRFRSQTDTEIIPHLWEEYIKRRKNPLEALLEVVNLLEGSFAIVALVSSLDKIFVVRKDSPLSLGVLKGGFLVASDIPAISFYTKRVVNLADRQVGVISKSNWEVYDFHRRRRYPKVGRVTISSQQVEKGKFTHFMLKEICEQPQILKNLYSLYIKRGKVKFKDLTLSEEYLRTLKRIFIFACGTAFHAGFVGKYLLEKYARVSVEIDVSSEARYRSLPIRKGDLVIAISQSGETADTLASVREVKLKGAKVLGICNVLGSTLTKEADTLIPTFAGPEIGVASTKAYTAQLFVLSLFTIYLAKVKGLLTSLQERKILKELREIPRYQEEILKDLDFLRRIAERFSKFGCFLFLGRGINYPSALEGALKLKEISYIPAEGYPAGEMKHGPIALIDEYRAVVCIAPQDNLYEKMISNICEIKARKGKILAILTKGDKEIVSLAEEKVFIPKLSNQDLSPLLVAIPLQSFAYFVAKNLGCEIDQPRNLAKSVTVE
ncbi:MAG: glutamine--fructose-6-phosphate transaminase (isomerizing) [Candidatus Omnitrophota bacterium]|nr:MAG: glutamine--fructose-6-phosphate transaminase (isomerizing) [Candidatus Omnitrophota bacterium]